PAGGHRPVPHRSGQGRRLCKGPGWTAGLGRHLRRYAGRADPRRRPVHRRGHERHPRLPAGSAGAVTADRSHGPAVVAVDLGTGGPKVALVTLDGRLLWSGMRSVPTERPAPARAIQEAELWWTQIVDLVCEGLARSDVDPAAVVAFAVTGQWGSTVPVDAAGNPVGM